MINDIKKFWLNKLLFPKTVEITKPGIIVSKTVSRISKKGVRTRTTYYPECIGSALYNNIKKEIGREKADLLWYKIGKEMAVRHLSFSKEKKIPEALIPFAIEYILDTFGAAGMTFAKKIEYDHRTRSLVTKGENCVVCRDTGSGHLMAGLLSGVMSYINQRNIEAEPICKNCPKNCGFAANLEIKEKFIPRVSEICPLEDYDKVNFPRTVPTYYSEFKSLSDFLKFKKIDITKKENTFHIKGHSLMPSEMGLPGIMLRNYSKIGELEVFKETVISAAESFMNDVLSKEKEVRNREKTFRGIVSALGGGFVFCDKKENKVRLRILNPPIDREEGRLFRAYILNGYLNSVFGREVEPILIKDNLIEFAFR